MPTPESDRSSDPQFTLPPASDPLLQLGTSLVGALVGALSSGTASLARLAKAHERLADAHERQACALERLAVVHGELVIQLGNVGGVVNALRPPLEQLAHASTVRS
jgi:hypothetical protein